MKIKIYGAEKVRFIFKDKDSGKRKTVDSCRVCLATYDENGDCTSFDTLKTTPDFADWCDKNAGKTVEGTLMYDKFGRVVYIHDAK